MLTLYVMVGIPFSGKATRANYQEEYDKIAAFADVPLEKAL